MQSLSLILPALYADHHVAPVRLALEALPGVTEIRLMPAAHAVSLQFDPTRQSPAKIEAALASAGYHTGDPEREFPSAGPAAPRHTAIAAGTLSFTHEPPAWEGRPPWPCPGFDTHRIPES